MCRILVLHLICYNRTLQNDNWTIKFLWDIRLVIVQQLHKLQENSSGNTYETLGTCNNERLEHVAM